MVLHHIATLRILFSFLFPGPLIRSPCQCRHRAERRHSTPVNLQTMKIAEQKQALNAGWAEYQARYEENDRIRRAQIEARQSIRLDVANFTQRTSTAERHAASRLQLHEAELDVRHTARHFAELRLGSAAAEVVARQAPVLERGESLEVSEISLRQGDVGAVDLISSSSNSGDVHTEQAEGGVIELGSSDDNDVVSPPATESSTSASTAESEEEEKADAYLQGSHWLCSAF